MKKTFNSKQNKLRYALSALKQALDAIETADLLVRDIEKSDKARVYLYLDVGTRALKRAVKDINRRMVGK